MNKSLLLLTGIVVIIVGAAGFIMSTRRNSAPPSQNTKTQITAAGNSHPTSAVAADVNGSFADLLALGGDKKCDWSGDMGGAKMTGVVYVSGKKMRSEAKSTLPSVGPFTAYVVGDGTTMTLWTSLAPAQKTTMPYTQMKDQTAQNKQAFNQFAQKYNYHCLPWTVDQSQFSISK